MSLLANKYVAYGNMKTCIGDTPEEAAEKYLKTLSHPLFSPMEFTVFKLSDAITVRCFVRDREWKYKVVDES